ncbi:MAG: 5'-methylthioadenosine/S-adenosylhomocysteine nucleosidase [Brachybacterium sp.]|nr:5'-methylthioadenosine/S-adenosylhomocysteine nucleosidase [Brachybacterium sp.]
MPATSSCDLLVLTAMPEEAAPFRGRLRGAREVASPLPSPVAAVRGDLEGADVLVVTTGIGIAAASAAVTWAILSAGPQVAVSAGSAGGLAADLDVGSVVVGDSFAYSIADATAFGYAPGQVPGDPERHLAEPGITDRAERAARDTAPEGVTVRRGLMLSGDAFVTADLAAPMRERFPGALSADMETTALARTCAALDVPFTAVRSISDLCGPRADQQFHLAVEVVAERSAAAVAAFAGTCRR